MEYSKGNWSEGLTAYLADHLLQEQQGRDRDYRRAALQKYANHVNEQRDFPLHEFRMRHGEASQAIGYSKALMFFHMLRHKLGDEAFIEGLRRFYRDCRFRQASYADLQKSFEAISQTDLSPMFSQWVERTGAPSLNVRDINVSQQQDEFILEAVLEQTQHESVYRFDIPLLVDLGSQQPPLETSVISGYSPANPQQAIVWLEAENPAALSGLARKLPHYGKYSFLVFSGDEPSIVAKGQWPVLNSPLRIDLNLRPR